MASETTAGPAGLQLPTPLALAQANLADPSPFCRHLMLLTESSAALRLLFECGLVQRNRTVVLVGSQFPRDANSELRMVRQINEVKRAMQCGHTVVLVNHEGIFPSLYDVLNMRYATKRSAETGKVTRMLRLAVGNRSQWCAVGDGFKIVVVVETKDAYEKLDLPLLNRFEKQMLRAEDVLDDDTSKRLGIELGEWVNKVEQLTQVRDPFIGVYSQTLASLVHCKRVEMRTVQEPLTMDSLVDLQHSLMTLISPLARIRGGDLLPRVDAPKDIFGEVEFCLAQKLNLLVLTYSSTHDFEIVQRQRKGESDTIVLGGVTSEREFVQALKRLPNPVKFVQCDPNTTPQGTIEHARYLVQQELHSSEICVFVIHLPPGGKKKRSYNVDFQSRWRTVFIDDLIHPEFMSLVGVSPLAWASTRDETIDHLNQVVRNKLSVALAQARPPLSASGEVMLSARERVQQILKSLDEPAFAERVLNGTVRDILAGMSPAEHVEMVARGESRAGTVANSLVLALETLIVRAFSLALRWFDINFNLSLLASENEQVRQLWVLLCSAPTKEFIAVNVGVQDGHSSLIKNWGRPGYPVQARFPWSWRVFETLDQALTSSIGNVEQSERFLEGVAETAFGSKFPELSNSLTNLYLQDVCGFHMHRRVELSLEEQSELTKSWLLRKDKRSMGTVARAHLTLHRESWAIFALLSIRVALTPLSFPNNVWRFEKNVLGAVCNFLLAPETLEDSRWIKTVETVRMHVHASFLSNDEDVKRNWADVLFRHAFAETMSVPPARAPSDLLGFHSDGPSLIPRDAEKKRYSDYLERIARDVVAQPWFSDQPFIRAMLKYAGEDARPRTVRLCFLEAILRHDPAEFSDLAIEQIFSENHTLFALALDLTEDIADDDSFFPPACVLRVKRDRAAIRSIVTERLTVEKDVPLDYSARAFALNEIFAMYGDFGAIDRIRASPELLRFFQAPEMYLREATERNDSGQSNKPKVDVTDMQRMHCLSLIAGDSLFRECMEVINPYAQTARRTTQNANEEGEELDMQMAVNFADSKKATIRQLFANTSAKVASLAKTARLWEYALNDIVTVSSHLHIRVFVLGLILAATGKSFSENRTLSGTAVMDLIDDVLTYSDPALWVYQQDRAQCFKLYRYLARLACSQVTEPIWDEFFLDSQATNRDKFILIATCCATLLQQNGVETSYMADILHGNPGLAQAHLPGMHESEFAEIASALGYVGWWKCPNGHRYAVGECTMPMERSKCPECGASVGGQDHTPVRGVTRVDDEVDGKHQRAGYNPPSAFNPDGPGLRQLRSGALSLLHVCFHAVLAVGLRGPKAANAHQLMNSFARRRDRLSISAALKVCETTLHKAWDCLRNSSLPSFCTDADCELLFTGFLTFITRVKSFRGAFDTSTTRLTNFRIRQEPEMIVQDLWLTFGCAMPNSVVQKLNDMKVLLGTASNSMELARIVSKAVTDESEALQRNSMSNWRYRAPIGFPNLLHELEQRKIQMSFLTKFCQIEPRLKLVTYLADVMEWVAVLTDAISLRKRRISREEASRLSNRQALEDVFEPGSGKLRAGFEVLTRFCKAFNETFVLVPNLYECQRNPFLTEENSPRVDLSGGRGLQGARTEMSFDTPVSFSLSAIVQGDADAQSLCLFQLVRALQQLNNTILEELNDDTVLYGGQAGQLRQQQQAPEQVITAQEAMDLPVTTMSTPRAVILSRLIDYDRDRDLLPILACCSGQAAGLERGATREIDLAACTAALQRKLLAGKQPLRVVIPSFEFAGEARRSGTIAALKTRIPQCQLNKSVLFSIAADLDTDSRIQPLIELVDSTVAFLSGFTGFDSDTLLGDFVKNVLGMDESQWLDVAPLPVQQHVRLCHLAALFAFLEEARNGSPLDAVHERYKKSLPAGIESDVRIAASKLDLDVLLPILKDLLVSRLVEETFPEDAQLDEYLEYSTDQDLTSLEWFREYFPKRLTLAYSFHTWRIWMECV